MVSPEVLICAAWELWELASFGEMDVDGAAGSVKVDAEEEAELGCVGLALTEPTVVAVAKLAVLLEVDVAGASAVGVVGD